MIKLSLAFSFLFGVLICFGQKQLDKDTSKFEKRPLYFLNSDGVAGILTMQIADIIIDANDIENVEVLKDNKITSQYGKKAENGVINITIKPGIELITINQLFDRFNIAKKDRKLLVFLDSTIAYHPSNILFQLKSIKSVSINEDKSTGYKYVSIITVFVLTRPKKGEIRIGGS